MEIFKKIFILILKKIKKEKKIFFFVTFLLVLYFVLAIFSQKYLVKIPKKGGEIHEVVISDTIGFINPILAHTSLDKTIMKLVYSPLFKKNLKGELVPVIAEKYEVSPDHKKYKIFLKKNFKFDDGVVIKSDDVIFTINQIKKPENNSYLRGVWANVDVKKIDDFSFELNLKQADYYFKNALVFYPIPKHIWEKVDNILFSEFNLNPVGSGILKIDDVERVKIFVKNKEEEKIKGIVLSKNKFYPSYLYLDKMYFDFYPDFNSYFNSELYSYRKEVNQNIFSTENLNINENLKTYLNDFKTYKILEDISYKIVFKNNNSNEFLRDKKFRKFIFDVYNSKNKEEIIKVRDNFLSKNKEYKFDKKNNIFMKAKKIVSFKLETWLNEDNYLKEIAEKFKNKLKEAGINVQLNYGKNSDFLTKIKDRDYEAIISGFKNDEEYYYYYYYSKFKDFPAGNIAQINSSELDKLLIDLKLNDWDEKKRLAVLEKVHKIIDDSYLYLDLGQSNSYYYLSRKIYHLGLENVLGSENRFKNISNWIIKAEMVLPYFTKNKEILK